MDLRNFLSSTTEVALIEVLTELKQVFEKYNAEDPINGLEIIQPIKCLLYLLIFFFFLLSGL